MIGKARLAGSLRVQVRTRKQTKWLFKILEVPLKNFVVIVAQQELFVVANVNSFDCRLVEARQALPSLNISITSRSVALSYRLFERLWAGFQPNF